jgi:RNA polymerase sigma factor (sigma-70 family)
MHGISGMAPQAIVQSPLTWSEAELVIRVLDQEPAAWSELVRRYRPVILRCIGGVLRRSPLYAPTDVEEVHADLMMSLWRDDMRKLRLHDPRRGARLGSWLGLLAKNAAHDFLRANAKRRMTDPVEDVGDLGCDRASPLDEVLRDEHRARVVGMLDSASERDRELFALIITRGLSVDELSKTMGISPKTVYTTTHKLLHRLATRVHASVEVEAAA